MSLSDLYSDEVKALCQKYKVKMLSAFGSLVKAGFNKDSDIDLVVDFEPLSLGEYGHNYFAFKFALEDYFNRPVDLLEEKEIKNPYFKKTLTLTSKSFMQNETKTWLFDIRTRVEEIELFIGEENYSFERYMKDLKTRRAVERNLAVIG